MNNQEKFKEDPLRQYIDRERIEKAPDGFTADVMSGIQMEAGTVKVSGRLGNKSFIPVISAVVTVLLIVAAIMIPGNQGDFLALPVIELIKNINASLPEIDFTRIFSFNLPGLLIYVFIGIFILTLFDRALFGLFHREK